MTDVARRQARSQKQRLDTALLERKRRDALADLGENLYELASRGEIELDELPELAHAVQLVEEIDQEIKEAAQAASDRLEGRRPVRLGRTRPGTTSAAADRGGERSGRPEADSPGRRADRDPARSQERVWRPPTDVEPARDQKDEERDEAKEPEAAVEAGPSSPRRARASAAARRATPPGSAPAARRGGGGIVFVDDDSAPAERDPDGALESYMNEDDVPRRR